MVEQTNGDSYVVNSRHLLALKRGVDGTRIDAGHPKYPYLGDTLTINAPDLAKKSLKFRHVFVGYKAGVVRLTSRPYKLDPYFLGLWLGDGDSDAPRITTADPEISTFLYEYAAKTGLQITETSWARTPAKRLHLSSGKKVGSRPNFNPIWEEMKQLGLPNNKHIPDTYALNTEHVRLALLAGFIGL